MATDGDCVRRGRVGAQMSLGGAAGSTGRRAVLVRLAGGIAGFRRRAGRRW